MDILDSAVHIRTEHAHINDTNVMQAFMAHYSNIYYNRTFTPNEPIEYAIDISDDPQQVEDDCGVFAITNAWHMMAGGVPGRQGPFNPYNNEHKSCVRFML